VIFCASTRAGFGHVEVGPAHALVSWNDWTYWLQPVQRHAIFLMVVLDPATGAMLGPSWELVWNWR